MAKLKEILYGVQNTDALLKSIADKKFLGEAGTKAIVDELKKKATKGTTLADYGITDAKIEEGVITLGEETLEPLIVDDSAATGSVLTKTDDGAEWQEVDFDGLATTEDLKKYVTGAEYVSAGTETGANAGKPCIELYNLTGETKTVLAHIPAEPFLKDSWVDTVTVADGTGANNGKKVLKFTYKTENGTNPAAVELPIEDVFKTDNYFTKTEINNLLYGDGGSSTDIKGGIVKSINDLKTKVDGMVFSDENTTAGTIAFTDAAGTKKTLITKQVSLDDVESRLDAIEALDFQEITAAQIQAWLTATT